MKPGMEVGLGLRQFVLNRDPSAPGPKGDSPSIFDPACCDEKAGYITIPLGREVGLGPGHTVLDGDPDLPKRGRSPQFSAHVYCGQRAARIKMALGMEVGLGASLIVLDGGAAPLPKKGAEPPISAILLWPNGWMD